MKGRGKMKVTEEKSNPRRLEHLAFTFLFHL
jgi:hypothetical protein